MTPSALENLTLRSFARDRRVSFDAGAFEALPVDEDIGAADIAEEVDHVAESDAVERHLGQRAIELGLHRAVFLVFAALLLHGLIAGRADIRPVGRVAQDSSYGTIRSSAAFN